MNTTKNAELKLEARGVKSFLGTEGHGFNATLYINSRKAATVIDSADGGMYHWHWLDKEAEGTFADYVASLPEETHYYEPVRASGEKPEPNAANSFTFKPDADSVMSGLVDDAINARRLARLMKSNTLFRLKSETYKDGEWRKLTGGAFCPAAKEWLVKKYGDDLGEILNERKS
jgi:hypothetical protein